MLDNVVCFARLLSFVISYSLRESVRDDFTENTKRILAARAGHLCSNPNCRLPTTGPGSRTTVINLGVAAHITAASSGTDEKPAPRYDKSLTGEQRKNISNGIWLCQNCGKLIDSDESQFTVDLIKKWKKDAENQAFLALAAARAPLNRIAAAFGQLDEDDAQFLQNLSLSIEDNVDAVTERMRRAAQIDLAAFQATRNWPQHAIALSLAINANGKREPVSLAGIANATGVFSTLSLVSDPGTGKTTTLVQLANQIAAGEMTIPILLPLGEWSGTGEDFFGFIATRRSAFRSFRSQHFRQMAFYGRLVLLIDGWNEVDAATHIQARRQLEALRRDFPLLSIVIGTRRQAIVTPGQIVEIDFLSEDQQRNIARNFPGETKEAVLDRAWRTPGVRELISIPLYLNALLESTPDGSFPQTKDQVLSAFVAKHEASPEKVEILRTELFGFHKDILIGLAVEANRSDATSLSDEKARRAVTLIEGKLKETGQVTTCPQPSLVLDLLVDSHALVRSSSQTGNFCFQHQQFQEWYASFEVGRVMLKASQNDLEAIRMLGTEMLNRVAWEESLLFASERLSRENAEGIRAVGEAIIMALGIDPMLASEMIFRSDTAVWAQIRDKIVAFATRWHQPNKIDRGLRFMMTTGKADFSAKVWPFIAIPNNQIYLRALRLPYRFRPSVLGPEAAKRLSELSNDIRGEIITAIVHESGFDGLELGTQIAKADSNLEVVVEIIHALAFRRADRHIQQILDNASNAVWEKIAAADFPVPLIDPKHRERMAQMRKTEDARSSDPIQNIYRLAEYIPREISIGEQIARLIESSQFPTNRDQAAWAIKRAFDHYPDQVKIALLHRMEAGLPLPGGTEGFLKDIPEVDDGPVAVAALDKTFSKENVRFALTIVGPHTIGSLIDELFAVHDAMQAKGPPFDESTRKEYWRLREAIAATRQTPFINALLDRAKSEEPHRIQLMADLVALHGKDERNYLTLPKELQESLIRLVDRWVTLLLSSPTPNRNQMASVAQALERLPLPQFVQGLEKLLERDLAEWTRAREELKKPRAQRSASNDASMSWTLQYRRAFAAVGGTSVVELMKRYLTDLRFGIDAAIVLSAIWRNENGPIKERRFGVWHDFSEVKANRFARQANHHQRDTCDAAETIFAAVRRLLSENSDSAEQRHAIQLATIALRLPHGSKQVEFDALMALPLPLVAKQELLAAAVEAGEVIKTDILESGVSQLLEAAKKEPWRLDKTHGELMGWLELFPFSDRPTAVLEVLEKLPGHNRQPWDLDRLLLALSDSPESDALKVLRALADRDNRILDNYHWITAVFSIGTEEAAYLLIDLICGDALTGNSFPEKRLTAMAKQFPRVRAEILRRYSSLPLGGPHSLLERVLIELADPEIVLAFVRDYARLKRPFDGNLAYAIGETAVGKRPVADWPNAYNQFSVPLSSLRRELFRMILADNSESALAEACLNEIEELRDEHGRPDNEPRHLDIESGFPWPKEAAEAMK